MRGVLGQGLDALGVDLTGEGTLGSVIVKPDSRVPFSTPFVQQYLTELMGNEVQHVWLVRKTIQSLGAQPIARPELDLMNSFNTIAQEAGIGYSFDPFASEANFILAAENFETVGVTAYRGAAPLLTNKTVISASAGILAVEAYHSGVLRLLEFELGPYSRLASDRLAGLRTLLTANPAIMEQGVVFGGWPNLVPTDGNALPFARTPREVLNINYGVRNAPSGGFFPNGVNGTIR